MKALLQIDSSARKTRSISRGLTEAFAAAWAQNHPSGRILQRDVGMDPPPALTEGWIAASALAPEDRTAAQQEVLALSDVLIAEVEAADVILLGVPLYNYGAPASLKAWIDQVIRVNRTFTFDRSRGDFPIEPVLSGKVMVLVTTAGEFGFQPGGVRAHMDHLAPHMRTIERFLGVDDFHHVGVEYQAFGDDRFDRSYESAMRESLELARALS